MEADQDSWASASSHVSCWSRDDDSLAFESLSLASLQSSDPAHSIITDGLQRLQQYNHPTLIRDVTVNHSNNWFYLLDDSGIMMWNRANHQCTRVFQFPPYKHKLLTAIIFSDYYNVYFVLTTSGHVKVLNKNFSEVHTLLLPVEQSKVSCIAFNDRRQQFIIGCLGGIKVFNYHQQQVNWKVIKPMAQYALILDKMSDYIEGVWIRKITVSTTMDWLIGISGCDVLVFTFDATLLVHMRRLHQGHVTACVFLPTLNYYITSSEDASLKVWSQSGALITSFTSHLKEVMGILVHPHCQWVVISCSLDGTVKQWNLVTLQMEYSLTSSIGRAEMMGLVNKNYFYIVSNSSIELVEFSCMSQFWALSYCKMSQLSLVLRGKKAPQIVGKGVDGSVRLYSYDSTHVTTVLPSPYRNLSLMSVAYCNETHKLLTLMDSNELWLYSTGFNPARRVAVFNGEEFVDVETLLSSVLPVTLKLHHKADITSVSACNSLLLLGMMDGRVIILEPKENNELKRIGYLQAFVSPITLMKFDKVLNTLMCASNYSDDSICIQLWDVTNWTLLTNVHYDTDSSLVDCAMLEKCMMTGHFNGTLSLFTLNDSSSLNKSDDNEETDESVTSVQSTHCYSLFASTHSSSIVRLWNSHFILLVEVSMSSPSLHACCFLPGEDCLILSLHNHLYRLMLRNVLPHTSLMLRKETIETSATINASDSVVIDDLTNSHDPLMLQQHLAGAVAMTISQTRVEKQEQLDDNSTSDDDNESVLSAAATETYQSPLVTPLRSAWLFPSLGPPSTSGELSSEGSVISLITPVEELQTDHPSNVEGQTHDRSGIQFVIEASPTNDQLDSTNRLPSANLSILKRDSVNHDVTKVTKVSGSKRPNKGTIKLIRRTNKHLPKQLINKNKKKKLSPVLSPDNKAVTMDTQVITVHAASTNDYHVHSLPSLSVDNEVNNRSLSMTDRPSSMADRSSSMADRRSSMADRPSSMADRSSSMADRPSSMADRPSSVTNNLSSVTDRSSSMADRSSSMTDRSSSMTDRSSSMTDRSSSVINRSSSIANKSLPSNKTVISVTVNNNGSPDRRSEVKSLTSHSTTKSCSSTYLGWQLDAIERAKWKSCIQSKRHEDAQLRRLQKETERLIKSASHLRRLPTTDSKWQQYSVDRPRSVLVANSDTSLEPNEQHGSFHKHKLNCSNYRLQLYDHEK